MYENYLAHHGILGMRWGVRRYQNKDGSLTAAGRKRLGIESTRSGSPRHTPSSAKKQAKQKAANLEKARQARAEKKAHEEAKKTALEKGTASDVLKFKGELTNQELQNAVNRINLERQLSSISASEVKSGWDKVSSIADKTQKIANLANRGIDLYNLVAKVNNAFTDDQWAIIGEKKEKDKKSDKAIEKLIRTGTKEEILKAVNAGKMSKKEIDDAMARLKYQDKLIEEIDAERRARGGS